MTIAESITNAYPYRTSRSSWAGGRHTVTVLIGDIADARCETVRAWSRNGKWRGTNSQAKIWITHNAALLFPTGMAAGLVVVDAEQLGPREYRMKWVEQGRGVGLKTVKGYYIRGRHVVAPSIEAARKKAAKMRQDAAQAEWQSRSALRRKKRERQGLTNVWVGIEDSLAAGNCRAASELVRQQAARLIGAQGGEFALRADILLSLRDDLFARRAITQAQQSRHVDA